jgi:hypothetical protein
MFPTSSLATTGAGFPPFKAPPDVLTYRQPKNNAQVAALRAADVSKFFRAFGSSMEASNWQGWRTW